jgi:hypothetical protein
MSITPIGKPTRFTDPNKPVKDQATNLLALIKEPPENSRILTVTPELAQWILENINTNNRRQRPGKIKAWAAVMAAGDWLLTGDTIKFGKSGALIDGQNRLAACFRGGVPFRTYAAFGIEDRAFNVIDTNSVRSNADTFKMAGVEYDRIVAHAVRWLMIYDGDPLDRSRSIPNTELWDYYQKHVDAEQMRRAARHAYNIKGLPHSALAAHLYLFYHKNAKATKAFATDLEGYQRGGKKLIDRIADLRKQAMGRLHETQVNALFILTWRAYRDNKTVTAKTFKWTETNEYPAID